MNRVHSNITFVTLALLGFILLSLSVFKLSREFPSKSSLGIGLVKHLKEERINAENSYSHEHLSKSTNQPIITENCNSFGSAETRYLGCQNIETVFEDGLYYLQSDELKIRVLDSKNSKLNILGNVVGGASRVSDDDNIWGKKNFIRIIQIPSIDDSWEDNNLDLSNFKIVLVQDNVVFKELDFKQYPYSFSGNLPLGKNNQLLLIEEDNLNKDDTLVNVIINENSTQIVEGGSVIKLKIVEDFDPAVDAYAAMLLAKKVYKEEFNKDISEVGGDYLTVSVNLFETNEYHQSCSGGACWKPKNKKAHVTNENLEVYGFRPLTTLDIISHELTHGLLQELIGEPDFGFEEEGAIHESLADIFGTAIEFYATPNDFDWGIGEDIYDKNDSLRSLKDPSAKEGALYYEESYWDTMGIYQKGGVLSYWFYLIAQPEGKVTIGTNFKNQNYKVKAIGFDKAIKFVYHTLSNYSRNSINFNKLYEATTSTSETYFDKESDINAIADAWYAVGDFGTGSGVNPCKDTYEPNQGTNEASTIFSNLAESPIMEKKNSYIFTPFDQDWYKLILENAGALSVNLNNLPNDYNLELLNSEAQLIGSSFQTGELPEQVSYVYNGENATTLYIKITGASGASNGCVPYTLGIDWMPKEAGGEGICTPPIAKVSSSLGDNPIIQQGQSINLSASGGATYSWSPTIGLSSATGQNVTATPSSPITYTVKVTNSAGCSSTAKITVDVRQTIQAPLNDESCGAVLIPMTKECTFFTVDNRNATTTANPPVINCDGLTEGDVWFSFIAPPSGEVKIESRSGPIINDAWAVVYSGSSCQNLSLFTCVKNSSSAGNFMPAKELTGLNPGAKYWIRTGDFNNNHFGTYGICVYDPVVSPPPPPPSDCDKVSCRKPGKPEAAWSPIVNSLIVSWDPVDNADYYLVRIEDRDDNIWVRRSIIANNAPTLIGFDKLEPDTRYYIEVIAVCGACSSNPSSSATYTTEDKPQTVDCDDLDIEAVNLEIITEDFIVPGDEVTIEFDILNQGREQIRQTKAFVWLSPDNNFGDKDDRFIDMIDISPLAPRERRRNISYTFKLFEGLDDDDYYIFVQADSEKRLPCEEHYNNNVDKEQLKLYEKPVVPCKYDIDVKSQRLLTSNPHNPADVVTIQFTVENDGDLAFDATVTRVWLSTNSFLDEEDQFLGEVSISGIKPNESRDNIQVSFQLNEELSSGNYNIIIQADAVGNLPCEDRTGNNTERLAITIENNDPCTIDTASPIISNCPDNISVTKTDASVLWTPPAVFDECSSVVLTATHNPTTTFPVGTTTVIYTATDETGNESKCSFTITVEDIIDCNQKISINPTVRDVCGFSGEISINASGGLPPYTYEWNTGATTAVIRPQIGEYTVTVTDANDCSASETILLNSGIGFSAEVESIDSADCSGKNGTVFINNGPICINALPVNVTVSISKENDNDFFYINEFDSPSTIKIDSLSEGNYAALLVAAHGFQSIINFTIPKKLDCEARIVNGFVQTWRETPVTNANILVDDLASDLTDTKGGFSMQYHTGVQLKVTKDSPITEGITISDLILVQLHILNKTPFQEPWQFLAADANGNGEITIADLLLIHRVLLNHNKDWGNGVPIWRFIDDQTEFTTDNPLNEPWNEYILMTEGRTSAHFIAVKTGDVNNSWLPEGLLHSRNRESIPEISDSIWNAALYALEENVGIDPTPYLRSIEATPTFEFYPNPTNDDLFIICKPGRNQSQLIITDLLGKVIYKQKKPNGKIRISKEIFPSKGVYLILLFDGKKHKTKKLVVN